MGMIKGYDKEPASQEFCEVANQLPVKGVGVGVGVMDESEEEPDDVFQAVTLGDVERVRKAIASGADLGST